MKQHHCFSQNPRLSRKSMALLACACICYIQSNELTLFLFSSEIILVLKKKGNYGVEYNLEIPVSISSYINVNHER